MKLSIEPNKNPDEAVREKMPWLLVAEIESETADVGRLYKIPIHVRYLGVLKHYHAYICGVRIDTQAKPANLIDPARRLLLSILNGSRFPTYMFVARRAGHLYPAYTFGDDVFATTAGGGPVFRHVELAKVREYLTDYLHEIKVLGKHGKSDKLHVRGIDTETFGLKRPVFYFKKRVLKEVPFWAPVFENQKRDGVYAIAANARRDVALENEADGRAVLRLREIVAHVLQADGRLNNLYDLRTDRIMTRYWERLEPTLTRGELVTFNGHGLTHYTTKDGSLHMLAEHRPDDEHRTGLYFGQTQQDVVERSKIDFERRDHLDGSE